MGVLWQRWLLLLLAQAAAGSLGGWLAGWPGALVAVLVGSWLWLWADCWQAHKLRRWLQSGSVANLPPLRGLWAVLGASARRWLQAKEKSVQAADVRVQGVLHAFHASPNGVILLDEQGQIEWCNRMAQTHFGLQDPRDLGQKLGYLVRNPALLAYWQAHDFSESLSMDGSQGARLSVRVFPYGKGKHLLLAQDVTALEQAEAMRREFVANVSHEIRTPLTVLIGFVETLQTLELPAEQRQRYLHLMGQQAQRMHHLVQDLLTLSRLEGSPLPGYDQGVGVADILEQCEVEARALSALLGQGGQSAHQLEFPPAHAPGMDKQLLGAPVELVSAFSNLITNALRYTPAGGRVQVLWQPQPDGSACLQVRDSGPGIAPEHLARLTERFYRIDRSRSRETGGTGLGLAIVKHALQRHGAQLHIDSQLGQGSTFTVHFPARRVQGKLEG